MSNKRPLTAEEIAIADRIKAIIAESDHLTEESVGAAVGVSQSQVSHWTGRRNPVSARRAPALAAVLGIQDPAEISLAYRAIAPHRAFDLLSVKEGMPTVFIKQEQPQPVEFKASQAPRFDLDSIVDAVWALGQAFAAKKLPFHLEDHPEYFLQVYKACLDLVDQETPGSTAMIFDLANEIAEKTRGTCETRGDSEPIAGVHQEDVAGRIRRKRRPKSS